MGNEISLRNKSKAHEVPRTGGKIDVGRAGIHGILLDRGKVNEEQVRQALNIAKDDRRNLGKTMVSLGFVSQADLAQAQARSVESLVRSDTGRAVWKPWRVEAWYISETSFVDSHRRLTS